MLKAFMIGVMGLGAGAYIILNSDNSFPNNERHEFISRISFASNCDLNNKSLSDATLDDMEKLWQEAKSAKRE